MVVVAMALSLPLLLLLLHLPQAQALPPPPTSPTAATMKAIVASRCGPQLALQDIAAPSSRSLQTMQVLVELAASSVNPIDWKILECGWGTSFPSRVGWDLAGTVVAVGTGCTRLKVGDYVWADIAPTFGAYAEMVVADEAQLGLAPPSLKPQDAATLPLVGMTTLAAFGLSDARGVSAATWRAGPATLIIGGTGGCGSVGIQLAKALGASRVFATGSDVNFMKALGADTAWDYRKTDWWTVLRNNTLDVVYDTVGLSSDATHAMAKLRSGGIFVTIAGAIASNPKPGVKQSSIHNWAKNHSTITMLADFVERKE